MTNSTNQCDAPLLQPTSRNDHARPTASEFVDAERVSRVPSKFRVFRPTIMLSGPCALLIVQVTWGCSEPQDPVDVPENPTEASVFTSGVGADTTSGVEFGTDTDDALVVNGCLPDAVDGRFGYVHQCAGVLIADVTASGLSLQDTVLFGNGTEGDFYSEPKVMACCSEFDFADSDEQPHVFQCYVDMIETLCRSLPLRIQEAVKDEGALIKEQATELANHVASATGQAECKAELKSGNFGDWTPGTISPPLEGTWSVGNDNRWNLIEDPEIVIEGEINDIFLPADPGDYIECVDNGLSDSQSFLIRDDDPSDFGLVLEQGDAALLGPKTGSGTFSGTTELASESNACAGALACSEVELSEHPGAWTIDSWTLHGAGPMSVTDSMTDVLVDWFRFELAGETQADIIDAETFRVPPGGAWFQLSGMIDGEVHMLPVVNGTPITFTRVDGQWSSSTFSIRYVDSLEDGWVLTVGSASWI